MQAFRRELDRLRWKVANAIGRCTDPAHHAYRNYGGRGIRVHPPWLENPALFIVHLMTLPGWSDRSLWLDRADPDKGYEPGNLRFVTPKESARNKSRVWRIARAAAEAGVCEDLVKIISFEGFVHI